MLLGMNEMEVKNVIFASAVTTMWFLEVYAVRKHDFIQILTDMLVQYLAAFVNMVTHEGFPMICLTTNIV